MTQTILYGAHETELAGEPADRDRLWIPLDQLERLTGWTPKREGMCRGETCVPVPVSRRADWLSEGRLLDFAAFAEYLGHSVVRDPERGVWAFGPAADRGPAGGTGPVVAPDFRLPDLDGNLHALSDYRGKKVLLYCWSSW